jgi:hypothetical protein
MVSEAYLVLPVAVPRSVAVPLSSTPSGATRRRLCHAMAQPCHA